MGTRKLHWRASVGQGISLPVDHPTFGHWLIALCFEPDLAESGCVVAISRTIEGCLKAGTAMEMGFVLSRNLSAAPRGKKIRVATQKYRPDMSCSAAISRVKLRRPAWLLCRVPTHPTPQ